MTIGKRMLRAAVPEVELPKWFEVSCSSSNGETRLILSAVISGKPVSIGRTLEKDSASVMDILGLWPEVVEKVPRMAKGVLEFLPVPRQCTIKGAPVPDESTPTKERARLTLSANVMGKTMEKSWDSNLDKLYMSDLVEMIDMLKAVQKAKDESPEGEAARE